jgi:hypothetical protein
MNERAVCNADLRYRCNSRPGLEAMLGLGNHCVVASSRLEHWIRKRDRNLRADMGC